MLIEIIHTDITKLAVDAIVNAANNSLTGGGGVDGAIHRAAGTELRDYCITLRGCATGSAKISPAFNLPAKFVIHAVGPVWNNGTAGEEKMLTSCYWSCLQLALENNIRTIAFPCISTGAYRFPFEKAGKIALNTIADFVDQHPVFDKIWLVVFDEKDQQQYTKLLNGFTT